MGWAGGVGRRAGGGVRTGWVGTLPEGAGVVEDVEGGIEMTAQESLPVDWLAYTAVHS